MIAPLEAYPLTWPAGQKRSPSPERSRFGREISFGRARDTLLAEISRLGGTKVILSTNIPLKLDGLPRAVFSPPKDKGVAIYFTLKNRPMVFACDEWDKIEHNVWAIAKTIEALRGIERWGSGAMLERAFTGFTALPSPETKKHWREVLGFMGVNPVTKSMLQSRRTELANIHHPDRGGEASDMADVNRAFDEAVKDIQN